MIIRKMRPDDYESVFVIFNQVNNLHKENRPDIYNDIMPFKEQHKEYFDSLFDNKIRFY
jgi:hypothetical protein